MRRTPLNTSIKNPLQSSRNWEENIRSVMIEPCPKSEDPLGYKAVFFLSMEAAHKTRKKTFEIGASFLAQRRYSLSKAGYNVPMTAKAIDTIEQKLGETLPMFLGGAGATHDAAGQYA